MTTEQTIMLAAVEREHGKVDRLADESELGEQLLSQCVTGARAYRCRCCLAVFAIDPDGECNVYAATPLVD